MADEPQPAPGPQYFFRGRGRIQEVKIWDIALKGGPSEPGADSKLPSDKVMTEFAHGAFGPA